MSGNHGDEYEGQVTLTRLVKELEPDHIEGRIIILPMANYPAAKAGLRTSPIDSANLNRVFPGDHDGTPTLQIAHYIETVLMEMADFMLDLHSGGSSLMYLPSTIFGRGDDPAVFEQKVGMMRAFGAPYAFMFPKSHAGGNSSAAATRRNVIAIGTEAGGAGTVTPEALRICERGVRNVLRHLGVLKTGELDVTGESDAGRRSERLLRLHLRPWRRVCSSPSSSSATASSRGRPQAISIIPKPPGGMPTRFISKLPESSYAKRVPGRVERGDCVFHTGVDAQID